MKKILAIVLALMLALTMTVGAVAQTENPVAGICPYGIERNTAQIRC